jgi:SNF2 family DNA or RNA helicase
LPALSYDGTDLILTIPDRPDLASGRHRLFISSVVGLRYDDASHSFRVANPRDVPKTIERLVDYLANVGVKCELDRRSQFELSSLQQDRDILVEARESGLRAKEEGSARIEVPGLVRQLMSYQTASVLHIVSVPNSANFSVPGSGKTTIALAAYAILKQRGVVNKILVVGPRSCFVPWEEEYEGCFGTKPKSLRVVGAPDHRRFLLRTAKDKELYLVTYQMAVNESRELIGLLQTADFLLVLDESHYIKRLEGGIWAENVLELGRYSKKRLILTGTPAPNSFVDLWSQFTFLWPSKSLLGERGAFKAQAEQPDSAEALKDRLKPFFCRIKKSDLGLPQPRFEVLHVDLKPNQQIIYNALTAKVLSDVTSSLEERAELRAWKKAQIVRLLQTASNPALLALFSTEFRLPPLESRGLPITELIHRYPEFEIPAKFEKVETLVRQAVADGEKVIVWTWFVHNIHMLRTRLSDLNPLYIFGEVPKDDEENEFVNREKFLQEFKTDTKPRILIANPSATAESISLHKVCRRAIYMDRTFNCGQYLQSLDRIHRVGLGPDDIVRYQIVMARETVDEVVNERLNRKMERMSRLLDDDLPVLNLEQPSEEVTGEDSDLDQDFEAVMEQIKSEHHPPK